LIKLAILAFFIWLFYFLFVKGNGYILLLILFSYVGGVSLIKAFFPSTENVFMTIMNFNISIATSITILIIFLAFAFLKGKE